ncbi:MAG: LptF/LptG family permease [Bacteroidetes bacterium]|nr:LptF/LptG family permease [Bacteroidota bacterium]
MKKLHLLIIRSYLGPFVLTFFVAVFLLLMQFLWRYVDELVGKGLDLWIIGEFMLYASATMVPLGLPLAILLSSIMTFGDMGEKYELVALKSSGISLQRIILPLIIVNILISIAAFLFSNNILPVANLKMTTLLHDIRQKRPALDVKEGIFYNGIDDISMKVAKKNRKTNMLYDVIIYDHRDRKGNVSVTLADSAILKITMKQDMLIMTLHNGFSYEEIQEEGKRIGERSFPHRKQKFREQTITIPLEGHNFERTDEDLFKDGYKMLTVRQLTTAIDSLYSTFRERRNAFSESLLKTNYYRKEDKRQDTIREHLLQKDTVLIFIDTDSVFESQSEAEKVRIIAMAANYARSSKTYISSTGEDYNMRSKWIWRYEIAWHKKFTLAVACLVLFFIGAPLGAIIRKGGIGMPVVVSVLLFILYYIIDITGEKFVKEGVLPAFQGMWLSTAVLFPLGLFLTYKATTDSKILDIDTYLIYIKRLLKIQPVSKKKQIIGEHKHISEFELAGFLYKISSQAFLLTETARSPFEFTWFSYYRFSRIYSTTCRFSPDDYRLFCTEYDAGFSAVANISHEHSYLTQKIGEFPVLKDRHRINRVLSFVVNITVTTIVLLPVGIILLIWLYRERNVLIVKLRRISEISRNIMNVLETPEILEMTRSK